MYGRSWRKQAWTVASDHDAGWSEEANVQCYSTNHGELAMAIYRQTDRRSKTARKKPSRSFQRKTFTHCSDAMWPYSISWTSNKQLLVAVLWFLNVMEYCMFAGLSKQFVQAPPYGSIYSTSQQKKKGEERPPCDGSQASQGTSRQYVYSLQFFFFTVRFSDAASSVHRSRRDTERASYGRSFRQQQ